MNFINKITRLIASTWIMASLFLVLSIAMGIATFIENDFGINTARILVYNTWWFEGIMVLFIVNFFSNINRFSLLNKKKRSVLLIHLSLVIIIIGALTTRYYGFEGLISIREGESADEMLIDEAHLNLTIEKPKNEKLIKQSLSKPLLLSQKTQKQNQFVIETVLDRDKIEIIYLDYIEQAKNVFYEDREGDRYLKVVSIEEGQRQEFYIKEGDIVQVANGKFAFNRPTADAVNFLSNEQSLSILSPFKGSALNMSNQQLSQISKDKMSPLALKSLYKINDLQFVIPEESKKGQLKIERSKNSDQFMDNALSLLIKTPIKEKRITVFGNKQKIGEPITELIGGYKFKIAYGAKPHKLPFKIKLQDFIADKYPGTTNSYAGFKSKVLVSENDNQFEADIFMNNVLDHKGYRFFQASFHPDEKGTILAVNHDRLGTWITYIGYFLLYLGLLAILFNKNSRFRIVAKKLKKLDMKSQKLSFIFAVIGMLTASAQNQEISPLLVQDKLDSIVLNQNISEHEASRFGRLIIQDVDGRMKPINTYSSEFLRKISKKDSYQKLNADQVFLAMIQFPELWYNLPLIYVKPDNDSIRKILGVQQKNKQLPLAIFFDEKGSYKLRQYVNKAYRSAVPNQFEKDFIETDQRVNLLYNNLSGATLKLFPIPEHENNKWIAPVELKDENIPKKDSLFISQIIPLYTSSLNLSKNSENNENSRLFLESIEKYQKKYGAQIRPSDKQIETEILYNKYDVFKKLFSWYLYAGCIMLIIALVYIFKKNKGLLVLINISRILIFICFALHTIGLLIRWYISGHAPWSDAYESIIYISWATMLFGMVWGKKSNLTLAVAAFVVAVILMVAHWNWLDPEIANLQPVLNSYWLMIHVAIIVASYGPFTIGMIIGFLSLILMTFLNKKNHQLLKININKLLLIVELALTVGLIMLTIGNFLGAQWANESWGRYWAWDPKETWALISILLYAFIIHMRLVPKLRSKWLFALVSVLAFYSILMTYFGVNFYLSGLHSYAKGDNIVTPNFVYYSIGLIMIIGAIGYRKQRKYKL